MEMTFATKLLFCFILFILFFSFIPYIIKICKCLHEIIYDTKNNINTARVAPKIPIAKTTNLSINRYVIDVPINDGIITI